MKVLLDACVIYPTVMRQMILGVAGQRGCSRRFGRSGLSANGCARRTKLGPEGVAQARRRGGDCWRRAGPTRWCGIPPSLEARLWLPDPADVHVLAAAIAGSADMILTLNARDFPRNILAEEGLSRADPDSYLQGHVAGTARSGDRRLPPMC